MHVNFKLKKGREIRKSTKKNIMSELWSTRKVMNGGDFDRSSRPGSGRSDGGHENPRMLNQECRVFLIFPAVL